jgi:primosomal protein N' (replication factor Y) (superfamily II helicase)
MKRPGALSVAVETPRHSSVGGLLDYASEQTLAPGTLVRVPLGRRDVPGIVWEPAADAAPTEAELRPLTAALSALPPLDAEWRELIAFAASYYQRGVGELALAVLPPDLRKLDDTRLARRLKRLATAAAPEPAAGVW